MHWQHPEWLWALWALPIIGLLTWRSRSLPVKRSKTVCAAIRGVVWTLLLVALAQPYATRRTTDAGSAAVIFLLDRSESIGLSDDAVNVRVADYRQALPAQVKTCALDFAGVTWPTGTPGPHPCDETNIEQALRTAGTEFPDAPNRQVIVFTDSRATTGDAVRAAEELRAQGAVVHVVPMGQNVRRGPRITGLTPPALATVGQPARLTVRLASDWSANATVRVLDARGIEQARRSIAVDGDRAVVLLVKPEQRGVQEWSVVLSDESRPPGEVVTIAAPFYVEGAPKVLLADPFPGETGYLGAAVAQLKLEVDTLPLDHWPRTANDFSPYDTAIISDWPAPDLDRAQLQALTEFVERRGGGLLFIGGANVKTQAWHDSGVERLLPITFVPQVECPVPPPAAAHVCFVLDRSGSMAGWKLDMVKAAFARSLGKLPPNSTISVIAFDADAHLVVDCQSLADRDEIIARVNTIGANGGTIMGPAIDRGLDLLRATKGPRYMIVLSDGQTADERSPIWSELSAELATENVRVTSIAVGQDADRRVLAYLALQTGGEFHFSPDASSIPAVFVEQAQKITE
ncbi:MAG: VWA domain-containing protein, partial [Planctomycetota bacterium]